MEGELEKERMKKMKKSDDRRRRIDVRRGGLKGGSSHDERTGVREGELEVEGVDSAVDGVSSMLVDSVGEGLHHDRIERKQSSEGNGEGGEIIGEETEEEVEERVVEEEVTAPLKVRVGVLTLIALFLFTFFKCTVS
jgi:hypothetical protein